MSVESDLGFWEKTISAGAIAITGLVAYVFKGTNLRIDRLENLMVTKAEFERHSELDESVQAAIQKELEISRNHVVKIFDQMRDMEKSSHENHIVLINAINIRNSK